MTPKIDIGAFPKAKQVVLVTDSNVDRLYGDEVVRQLRKGGFSVERIVFPAGERSKTLETYAELVRGFAALGLVRSDVAVALGAKVSASAKPDAFRKAAITAIEKLAKDLSLPKKISDFTISKEDLDFVSDNVLKFPCTEQNPKTVSKKKIIDLYKSLAK